MSDKPDWFRALSPLGRVPVLETGSRVLFESQVIAEYLDEITPGSLHPDDPLEKARHRAWIEYASATLAEIAGFYNASDAASFESRRQALRDRLARVASEVQGPFFAGTAFYIIDGVWGTVFRYLDTFETLGAFGLMPEDACMARWRAAVAAHPSVRDAPPEGYPARLLAFLQARNSHLGALARSMDGKALQEVTIP
nr:glutathione S-transferase family protein [Ruegeria pomeroyi]